MNMVLHWQMGTPVEYTQHPELYLVEQLGCIRLAPLLEIRRRSKLAQLKPGYLLVVCLQFVIGDETLIQCRHPGHHCLLLLVLCPIQFNQICGRSGTRRGSHRSDELLLFVVVHLVPLQVHYTRWSVRSSFWRASRVVMCGVLRFVVVKNCDRTRVYRGSCLIRQAVFLFYGSCLIRSAMSLIQSPSARVWRRVYAAPDCLLVKLAD